MLLKKVTESMNLSCSDVSLKFQLIVPGFFHSNYGGYFIYLSMPFL